WSSSAPSRTRRLLACGSRSRTPIFDRAIPRPLSTTRSVLSGWIPSTPTLGQSYDRRGARVKSRMRLVPVASLLLGVILVGAPSPAAATTGFDSIYQFESAFLGNLKPGDSG